MAGNLWVRPRIVEAFYHPTLGVILIYCVEEGVGDGAVYVSEPRYLWTDSDGDPAYLETVTASLREHWLADLPAFSAN